MELSKNAQKVLEARYLMPKEESWKDVAHRVSDVVSRNESDAELREKFYDMISQRLFIPGGRQLRNAGRIKGQLGNCFSLPLDDSIESIGEFMKNALILWSYGGGLGMSINLRPKGADIIGKGGVSSGLLSFLVAIDAVAETIESGGQRRAAALGICKASHPEVLDYINAKLKKKALPHFNLSVALNQEFLESVERDNSWEFYFGNRTYGKMKAKKLWRIVVKNMLESGEPGLINWNNFVKNNSYYFAPVNGANACSELPLEDYGICNLGSVVLPRFIKGTQTDWKGLEDVIRNAIRYLDNVIDINHYLLPEIEVAAKNARRCGLGVMGFADYLFGKHIAYGSAKALSESERLFRFIRDTAYHESMLLAQEKGAFPKFDRVDYGKSSFVRKLPHSLRLDIKKYGIRNCTLLAIAPTGTTSLIGDCNSGIEPLFAKAMIRRDNVGERYYVHPVYMDCLLKNKPVPTWMVDAHDITPEAHFETQIAIGKYIDSNISKTINVPKKTTVDELSHLLLEYIWDMKSVTVYRDGSRKKQILHPLNEKEARQALKDSKVAQEPTLDWILETCEGGVCEL
jgi:ribonucleoside-diphosphate reductase alpha chain